jgi:glycosyltransferase involved in cell wall biosynthesis
VALSVLHVTQPVQDGVARCVAALVRDQIARGWQVTVACPPGGELDEWVREAGAELVAWPARRAPGLWVALEASQVSRIVQACDPDLVHLHSSKAGLAGRLALRGRRPTVFQPHAWSFLAAEGVLRRLAFVWERRAARWAHALVCVSAGEREVGERAGIRASWRIVPNGIDLGAFPPAGADARAAARGKLGLGEGPLVVCVGRLSRQKGQDVLLDAWPLVSRRVPEARLVLVGDGPEGDRLRARAREDVSLVGRRDDVGEWLGAADVIAVPSRWDGLSLVVLEAMARARSVVVTDIPPARGLISPEAAVPLEDPRRLAEAIAERLVDPQLRVDEGSANRQLVEQNHDLRLMAEQMARLYAELVPARSPETSSQ